MVTWTGAWSIEPVAAGSAGATSTSTVGVLDDPEAPPPAAGGGADATVPTMETTPGVVLPLGRAMVTRSPALTPDCRAASSRTTTWRAVEVAPRTGIPGV